MVFGLPPAFLMKTTLHNWLRLKPARLRIPSKALLAQMDSFHQMPAACMMMIAAVDMYAVHVVYQEAFASLSSSHPPRNSSTEGGVESRVRN